MVRETEHCQLGEAMPEANRLLGERIASSDRDRVIMDIPRFHLAFPILEIEATRAFYHGLLGCEVGRESDHWIDFNFFGHQITGHIVELSGRTGTAGQRQVPVSEVDGKGVPIPHFGAILAWDQWHHLAEHLRAKEIPFLIEPHIRFPGQVAEQATMFIKDPSGNGVEFKAFQDLRCVWAQDPQRPS